MDVLRGGELSLIFGELNDFSDTVFDDLRNCWGNGHGNDEQGLNFDTHRILLCV